MDFLLTA